MTGEKEYYLSTKKEHEYLIYSSEQYKFTELEIINLIKICIVEGRSKLIGKKILSIYRDTQENLDKAEEKLSLIGIKQNEKPIREKKPRTR